MKEIDTEIRPGHRVPRPHYDPDRTTLAQRCRAKAVDLEELDGVRVRWRTLDDKRRKWKATGEDPWVLITDGRRGKAPQPGGHTDARTIQVMHEVTAEMSREAGVRISVALDRVEERVRALYGPELDDPMAAKRLLPPRSIAYRRINELGLSELLRSTTRQRASAGSKPRGPYRPSVALKPGELVQIDTTPRHVKALGEDGRVMPFQGPELEVNGPNIAPYAQIGELDLDAVVPHRSDPMPAGPFPAPPGPRPMATSTTRGWVACSQTPMPKPALKPRPTPLTTQATHRPRGRFLPATLLRSMHLQGGTRGNRRPYDTDQDPD